MKPEEVKMCAGCGEHPTRSRNPLFYVIRIDRALVDPQAVRDHTAIAMRFASAGAAAHSLARVFSPDEHLIKLASKDREHPIPAVEIHVCEECMVPVHLLIESHNDREEARRGNQDSD